MASTPPVGTRFRYAQASFTTIDLKCLPTEIKIGQIYSASRKELQRFIKGLRRWRHKGRELLACLNIPNNLVRAVIAAIFYRLSTLSVDLGHQLLPLCEAVGISLITGERNVLKRTSEDDHMIEDCVLRLKTQLKRRNRPASR